MTKRKRTHGRPRNTARIYYGANPASGEPLYWKVRVKNATESVQVNGSVIDALKGARGTVIGCHLSQCAMRNAEHFPHPCKLAAFTKATALIVTKIARGRPTEAVRYRHAYGRIVDLNDTGATRAIVKQHPELADRTFRLCPPQTQRPYKPGSHKQEHRDGNGKNSSTVPRGALSRAVKAGLVSPGLMAALS